MGKITEEMTITEKALYYLIFVIPSVVVLLYLLYIYRLLKKISMKHERGAKKSK